MKRILVGALVGAILMFAWQAVAHMFFVYHHVNVQQAPNSSAILALLSSSIKEDGQYFLPDMNVNATAAEQEEIGKNMEGKPWAFVTYHTAWKSDMAMPMIRQVATMFLVLAFFIWVLGKSPGSYGTVLAKSLVTGFIIFLAAWYPQNIWWHMPWPVLQAELYDLIAGWGLVGLWLGWWLNRRSVK